MTLSSCSVYLCLLRTGMQACTTMEGYTGCSDSFSLLDLSHDSFHYCLAFPLVFIAVIVFSSLLSYVPLGHSFILKQQFLGTDKILRVSSLLYEIPLPLNMYLEIRCPWFHATLDLTVLAVHCSTEYTEVIPLNPLQTGNPVHKWRGLEWLEVLWQSPTHFFPPVSDIDSIPQTRLQGIHCNGRFIYATSGEL